MNLITNAAESIGEQSGRSSSLLEQRFVSKVELDAYEHHNARRHVRRPDRQGHGGRWGWDVRGDAPLVFDPFFSTKFQGPGPRHGGGAGHREGHNGAIRIDSQRGDGGRHRRRASLLPGVPEAAAGRAPCRGRAGHRAGRRRRQGRPGRRLDRALVERVSRAHGRERRRGRRLLPEAPGRDPVRAHGHDDAADERRRGAAAPPRARQRRPRRALERLRRERRRPRERVLGHVPEALQLRGPARRRRAGRRPGRRRVCRPHSRADEDRTLSRSVR